MANGCFIAIMILNKKFPIRNCLTVKLNRDNSVIEFFCGIGPFLVSIISFGPLVVVVVVVMEKTDLVLTLRKCTIRNWPQNE